MKCKLKELGERKINRVLDYSARKRKYLRAFFYFFWKENLDSNIIARAGQGKKPGLNKE